MRIKLKDKHLEYPMLDSLMDVLYKAFTFMINNLKTFLNPNSTEDNLIYLCIYQNGMTNSLNSGSFRLQSVETEDLVQDVLNMFDNYVNSDSTLDVLDNSFKCYFRVLSVPHVNYPKHRRKTIPKPERTPSRLGCRLKRRFIITDKSGLFDIPGIKKLKLIYIYIFFNSLRTDLDIRCHRFCSYHLPLFYFQMDIRQTRNVFTTNAYLLVLFLDITKVKNMILPLSTNEMKTISQLMIDF
jgi:hypothetical protein